jgi:hypothetical protein
MANSDRARYEVLRRRVYNVNAADTISVGDMMVFSSSQARPASVITDSNATPATRKTTVQDGVADTFLGVALGGKPVGALGITQIVVGVDLVAEMDIAALGQAQNVGDQIEVSITDTNPAGAGTATGAPQVVEIGTVNPIGRLAKSAALGDTTVTVHMVGLHVRPPVVAD